MNFSRVFWQVFVAAMILGPSCGVSAQESPPPAPAPDPSGADPGDSPPSSPGDQPGDSTADLPAGADSAPLPSAADAKPRAVPAKGAADTASRPPPPRPDRPAADAPPKSSPKRPPGPPITVMPPNLFAGPSGRMVPGAVVFSSSSLDTGGGFRSDLRVGLGDVAEFGVVADDRVRVRRRRGVVRDDNGTVADFGSFADAEAIQPYLAAIFKLGVAESRLFAAQPALAIEFRKSFEKAEAGRDTRVASLSFTASKSFFSGNLSAHLGVGLWDAEVERETFVRGPDGSPQTAGRQTLSLHDEGAVDQVRPYGGLEFRALDNAVIVVDLYWSPEFTFGDLSDSDLDRINLRPLLAWGTRYEVGASTWLEAGVRVPDIGDANLLNAQIFGQLSFTYRGLRTLLVRNRP